MTSLAPADGSLLLACDGSCLKNPGGATGWAWVAEDGRWASGYQPSGTNQVAELWGVLSVLRDFANEPVIVQIDSEYAMNIATKWAKGWARKGWVTAGGKPVSNLGLVKSIYSQMLVREAPIRFQKVPGHDPGNRWPLNTAADERARAAAVFARQNGTSGTREGHDAALEATLRFA